MSLNKNMGKDENHNKDIADALDKDFLKDTWGSKFDKWAAEQDWLKIEVPEEDGNVHERGTEGWTFYNDKTRNDWIDWVGGWGGGGKDENGEEQPTTIEKANKSLVEFKDNLNDNLNGWTDWINGGKDWLEGVKDWVNVGAEYTKKALDWANPLFLNNTATKNLLDAFGKETFSWAANKATAWMGGTTVFGDIDLSVLTGDGSTPKEKQTSPTYVVSNISISDKNKFKNKFNIQNEYLKKLVSAGPDLFSNSFDVFLLMDSGGKLSGLNINNIRKISRDENLKNILSNLNDITVRTSSISIPQRLQSTYTQKFLNISTEIASHSVEFENKAELKIDLDSSLSVLNLINSLGGLPEYTKKSSISDDNNYLFEENENNFKYNFGSSYNNADIPQRLDIFVNSRSFNNVHDLYFNPNTEGTMNNIIYIFYNCKFLGTDSISFSRDSFSVQNKSFPFVFEHLYEAYKLYPDISEGNLNEDLNRDDKFGTTINDVQFITHI